MPATWSTGRTTKPGPQGRERQPVEHQQVEQHASPRAPRGAHDQYETRTGSSKVVARTAHMTFASHRLLTRRVLAPVAVATPLALFSVACTSTALASTPHAPA